MNHHHVHHQQDDHDNNEAAQRIAGLIIMRQNEPEEQPQETFLVSLRLPPSLAALVSCMASNAGMSRNEMLNMLIKAGVHDTMSRLPPELCAELQEEAQSTVEHFIK